MSSERENERLAAASQLVDCITLLHRGGDPATIKAVNEWLLAFTQSPHSTRTALDLLHNALNHTPKVPAEVVFFAVNLLLEQLLKRDRLLPDEAKREIFQVAYTWALQSAAACGEEGEGEKAVTTRVLLVCIASLLRSESVDGIGRLARDLHQRSLVFFVRYCQFVFEEVCTLWASFDQVIHGQVNIRQKLCLSMWWQQRRKVVFPELQRLEQMLLQALYAQVKASFMQCSRQDILGIFGCLQTWTLRRLTHGLEQENPVSMKEGVVGLNLMKHGIEPVLHWLLACSFQDDAMVSRAAVTVLVNLLWTEPPEQPWPEAYKKMIGCLGASVVEGYDSWSNKLRNAGLASYQIESEEMVRRVQGFVEMAAVLCERHLKCLLALSNGQTTLDICLIKLLISAVESALSVDSTEIALDFIEIAPEYITTLGLATDSLSPLLKADTLLELYRGTIQALVHGYVASVQRDLSEEDQTRLHSRLYDAVIATINSWSEAQFEGFSVDARPIAARMLVSTLCGSNIDHTAATAILDLLAALAESCEGSEEQLNAGGELGSLWIQAVDQMDKLSAHWAVRNAMCRLISELSPWLCGSTGVTVALPSALSYILSSLQVDLVRKTAAQALLVVSVETNTCGVSVSKLSIHVKGLRVDGAPREPAQVWSATGMMDIYNLVLSGPIVGCCRSSYPVFLTVYKALSNLFQAAAFERPEVAQDGLRHGLVRLLEQSSERLKLFLGNSNAVPVEEALLHCKIFTEVLRSTSMVRTDEGIEQATLEVVQLYWDVIQGLMSSLDALSHGQTQQVLAQAILELLQEVVLSGDITLPAAMSVLGFAQEVNRRYKLTTALKVINQVVGSQHVERGVIATLAKNLVESCQFKGEAVGIPEELKIPDYAAAYFVLWRTLANLYLEHLSSGVVVRQFEVKDLAVGLAFAFLSRPQGTQAVAAQRALAFLECNYRRRSTVSSPDALCVLQMTCFLAARIALSPLTRLLHSTLRNCASPTEAIAALISTTKCKYSRFEGLESVGRFLESRMSEQFRQRLCVRLSASWTSKSRLGTELSHLKLLLLGSLDPGFYLAEPEDTKTDESQIVDINGF